MESGTAFPMSRQISLRPSRIPTRVNTPDVVSIASRPTARHIKHATEAHEAHEAQTVLIKSKPEASKEDDSFLVSPVKNDKENDVILVSSIVEVPHEEDLKAAKKSETIKKVDGDSSDIGSLLEQRQRVLSFNANAKVFVPKRREMDNDAHRNIGPSLGFMQQPIPQRASRGHTPRFIDMDQFHNSIFNAMPYPALSQVAKRTASVQMQRLLEQTYSHWKSLVSDSPPYKWREIKWRDPTDPSRAAAKRTTRVLVGMEENSSFIVALVNSLILTTPIEGPPTRVEMLLNRASRDNREVQSTDVLAATAEDIRARTGDQDKDYLQLLLRWESHIDLNQRLFATALLDSFADTEDYKELKQVLGSIPLLHGLLLSPKGEKEVLQAYTKYFHSYNDFRAAFISPQTIVPEEELNLLEDWVQKHSDHCTNYGISQIVGRLGASKIGLFYCNNTFYTVMTCNGIPNKIRDIQFTPRNSETAENRIAELETRVFHLLTDTSTDCTEIDAVWKELRSDNDPHFYTGDFQETDPLRRKWTLHSSGDSWRGFLGVKNRLKKQAKIEVISSASPVTSSVGRTLPQWDSLIERIDNNNEQNFSKANYVANLYAPKLSVIPEDSCPVASNTNHRSYSDCTPGVKQSSQFPPAPGSSEFAKSPPAFGSLKPVQSPSFLPREVGFTSALGPATLRPPPGLTASAPENWTRPPVRQPSLPPPLADLDVGKNRSPDSLVPPENNFSARRRQSIISEAQTSTDSEAVALKIFDPSNSSYKPVFQPLAAQISQNDSLIDSRQVRGFTFADFQKFMASQAEPSYNAPTSHNNDTGSHCNGISPTNFISNPNSNYNSVPASVYGGIGSSLNSRPSSPPDTTGFRGLLHIKDNVGGLTEITNSIMAERKNAFNSFNGRPGNFLGDINWEDELRKHQAKLQAERRFFSNGSHMSTISETPSLVRSDTGPLDSAGLTRVLKGRC